MIQLKSTVWFCKRITSNVDFESKKKKLEGRKRLSLDITEIWNRLITAKDKFSFLVSDNILSVKQFLSFVVPEPRLYFSPKVEFEVTGISSIQNLLQFCNVNEDNPLEANLKLQIKNWQKMAFFNSNSFHFT